MTVIARVVDAAAAIILLSVAVLAIALLTVAVLLAIALLVVAVLALALLTVAVLLAIALLTVTVGLAVAVVVEHFTAKSSAKSATNTSLDGVESTEAKIHANITLAEGRRVSSQLFASSDAKAEVSAETVAEARIFTTGSLILIPCHSVAPSILAATIATFTTTTEALTEGEGVGEVVSEGSARLAITAFG